MLDPGLRPLYLDGGSRLVGGTGADHFVFSYANNGRHRVVDFEDGIDRILVDFEGVSTYSELLPLITEVGGSSVLGAGTATRLVIIDVANVALSEDDFIFV